MSKTLIFLGVFIPLVLIAGGLTMASVAVRALLESSRSLECFCPSCPATAFAKQGASVLGLIRVDIQGAIKKPGIYQLEIGQRVADLVEQAGGFAKDADQAFVAKSLNLATELKNQDKIYIPFFEEADVKEVQDVPVSKITPASNLISINQADSVSLQSLTGIGEVKAKAIIDGRPYSSLEELVSKGVISEKLLTDLRAQLSL